MKTTTTTVALMMVAGVLAAVWLSGVTDERHAELMTATGPSPLSPAMRGVQFTPADDDSSNSEVEGDWFQNKQGLWLFYHTWKPITPATPPSTLVFIAHGYIDHSGWYSELAQQIVQHSSSNTTVVMAHDHAGWGRSEGTRGHTHNFSDMAEDLADFIHHQTSKYNNSKRPNVVCIGKSMGGLMVTMVAENHPGLCDAIVLVSAGVKPARVATMSWAEKTLLAITSKWLPKLPLKYPFHVSAISKDPAVIKRQQEDELCWHSRVRARLVSTMIQATVKTGERLHEIKQDVLAMAGEGDTVTPPRGVQECLDKMTAAKSTKMIVYGEGARHNIFQESIKQQATDDLIHWIDSLFNQK